MDAKDKIIIPQQWRQNSVDRLSKSARCRADVLKCREALWKYNVSHRQSQVAIQRSILDNLKKREESTIMVLERVQRTCAQVTPMVPRLSEVKKGLEQELEQRRQSLEENEQRLSLRMTRPETERVLDEPERNLNAESDLLRRSVKDLECMLAELESLMNEADTSISSLQADLNSKQHALENIRETTQQQLTEPTLKLPEIKQPAGEEVAALVGRPESELPALQAWHEASIAKCERAKKAEREVGQFCLAARRTSEKVAEELRKAKARVGKALLERLMDLQKLIEEIGEHHRATVEEISEAELTFAMVNQALADIAEPVEVSKRRIRIYNDRPDEEKIDDDVLSSLRQEAEELNAQVEYLQGKRTDMKELIMELYSQRDEMAKDVQMKEDCLAIDADVFTYPEKVYGTVIPEEFWQYVCKGKTVNQSFQLLQASASYDHQAKSEFKDLLSFAKCSQFPVQSGVLQ
eukprot:gene23898-28995_t